MSKNVAVKDEELPSTNVISFDQDAGQGFEAVTNADFTMPFIRVLAQLSPQVNKRDAAYVEGAEAGMFFHTVLNEVYDGQEGILVVPCYYVTKLLEWKPRQAGGGFVGSYDIDDPIKLKTKRNDRNEEILPNGNLLATTAHWFVLFLHPTRGAQPSLITMTSTQLKKSRKWMSNSQTYKIANGQIKPLFSQVYKLKTVAEHNDKGDWFGYEISHHAEVADADLYVQARTFKETVRAGDIKVKHEEERASEESDLM